MPRLFIIRVLCITAALAVMPDGLRAASDLNEAQLSQLKKGEIPVQVRHSESHHKGWVEATVLIKAPPETIWRIMLDCKKAPGFVPGLKACRVLDSGPNWEIIRHRVKWIWFLPEVTYTFRAAYRKNRRIDFVKIDGDLREMRGAWHLHPISNGRQTVVRYGVYLDPGFFVPQWIVRHALKMKLPAVLTALRAQARNGHSQK